MRRLNARRFHHDHKHPEQPAAGAAHEASQHEPVPQVEAFSLLRAILMAGRPEETIAPLRRVREQARDDGKLGRAVDLAIKQFEQLSKLGTPIPRFFRLPWGSEDSLAEQCYKRGYFAASAAIWSAGFAADSKLADDMTAQNRYHAARSAALAAAGNGIDRTPLDEQTKTQWRTQALDWLRADLAYWAKHIESAAPRPEPGSDKPSSTGRRMPTWPGSASRRPSIGSPKTSGRPASLCGKRSISYCRFGGRKSGSKGSPTQSA